MAHHQSPEEEVRWHLMHAQILLLSGYAADDLPLVGSDADFLPKPYSVRELVARIRHRLLGTDVADTERDPSRAQPEFVGAVGDTIAPRSSGGDGVA